jgi:hypothetical protein
MASRAFAKTAAGYTGHQVRWNRKGMLEYAHPSGPALAHSRPDRPARATGATVPGGDNAIPVSDFHPTVPPAMPTLSGMPVLGSLQGRPGIAPNVGGSPAPHSPTSLFNVWPT